MKTYFIILFSFILTAVFAIGCGTLGAFDGRTLPVSKIVAEKSFDTLYHRYPEFAIPDKWKQFDTWVERGYGFLESHILYFKNVPEEMYYVTFKGDTATLANAATVTIAVRAVNNGNGRWKEADDFEKDEKERIQRRFDTVIVTRLKAIISESY